MASRRVIEEVRERTNLIEVVSASTQLAKVGGRWRGLCPFHSEKTPSFYVSEEKQVFHCFGCGASGNVFHYLMKREGLTFSEALASLARKAGVELDEGPGRAQRDAERSEAEKLARVLLAAAAYFQARLERGSEGTAARAYLVERGLDGETIRGFGLGYAPDDWESLVRHLQGAGCDLEACLALGLVAPRPKGGYYSRFRNRVMFPITDIEDRVIGFGGRAMPGGGDPKYLNSPESRLFHKGRTLYALARAREEIRKQERAVVVEGYFDAIQLHAHGIRNVVATLGTSLTSDHATILKRTTNRVVALFDADAAGRKAASRALPILLAADVFPLMTLMPAGEDPDTLVRKEGAEAFRKRLAAARPVLDVEIEEAIGRVGPRAHERDRAQCVRDLAPLVGWVRDPIERDLVLRRIAQGLDLDERVLRQALREPAPPPGAAPAVDSRPAASPRPGTPESGGGRPAGQSGRHPPAELGLVRLMLNFAGALERVAAEPDVLDEFESAELGELARRTLVLAGSRQGSSCPVASLADGAEPEEEWLRALATRLVVEAREGDPEDGESRAKEVEDYLGKIRRDGLGRRKRDLTRRIAEAQAAGDWTRVQRLLEEKAALVQGHGKTAASCEQGGVEHA